MKQQIKDVKTWIIIITTAIAVASQFDVWGRKIEVKAETATKLRYDIDQLQKESCNNINEHEKILKDQNEIIKSVHKIEIIVSEIHGYLKAESKGRLK